MYWLYIIDPNTFTPPKKPIFHSQTYIFTSNRSSQHGYSSCFYNQTFLLIVIM